jgi:tetratricopeptide (TPR) repeat protein
VWSSRARHAYLAGRYQEALELGREALAMSVSAGADEIRSEALLYLGGAKLELDDPTGIEDMRESLAVAKSINSAMMITRSLNNLGIALRIDGHVREAHEVAQEALEVAQRFGMQASIQFALGAIPFRLYEQGRWDEALRAAEEYLAGVTAGSHTGNENSARYARGLIRLGRDDAAGALADSELALEIALSQMANLPKYPAYGIRAYMLAATGDLEGAREATLTLAAFRREASDRLSFGGDAHVVWTWEQTGLLEEMIAVMGAPRRTPWVEAAEAVAAGSWARAAEIYERSGSALSVAYARLQAGRDADLRAALDFYRSVNASRYVRQAEAGLAATG